MANIWVSRLQRRFRRAALLSPSEKLLACAAIFSLHRSSGEAVGIAQGLLGYSVLARPFSKRFWTLSAWEDEAALRAFVKHPPYVHVMTALTPHMNKTKFVRWMVKGSQLPLRWDGALSRFVSIENR